MSATTAVPGDSDTIRTTTGEPAPAAMPLVQEPLAPPDIEVVEHRAEATTGSRPRPRASTALMVLATLAVGFTLYAVQDLFLPVLLAMFFALVGNPI
ncbi:MAG: hypothetical protein JWL98_2107, partial [Xanthomonadaceae bacterium]|nr:hypothetical protein [Xanthomonadaceae bacterium]